jgi:hypothetical protein
MFRLLYSLDPQIAPTAVNEFVRSGFGETVCALKVPPVVPLGRTTHWAVGPFTPRIARLVTCPEMWHHYVSVTSN